MSEVGTYSVGESKLTMCVETEDGPECTSFKLALTVSTINISGKNRRNRLYRSTLLRQRSPGRNQLGFFIQKNNFSTQPHLMNKEAAKHRKEASYSR